MTKNIISASIVIIAIAVFAFMTHGPTSESGAANSPQVVFAEFQSDEAIILDVRSQIEYDAGHITDAELFNVERMKTGSFPAIDKDKKIYVYCRSGNRSSQAIELMKDNGFTNLINLGAFADWQNNEGPTSKTEYKDYRQILSDMSEDEIAVLGDTRAPVTLIKYSDFKCPFCLRFSQETEPEIIDEYVKNNVVKIQYRNAAFQGAESGRAAEAGYCANEQNAFWEYHDALNQSYAQLQAEAAFSLSNLTTIAKAIGIDKNNFTDCLTSGKYTAVVSSETMHAQKQGVNSTPSFTVNGQAVKGALPFNVFQQLIESSLN